MSKHLYGSTSGASLGSKTKGSRGIGSIPSGVGGQAVSGPKHKASKDSGWPGVADSSLGPDDHTQSAK